MNGWRTLLIAVGLAALGALGTLVAGAVAGMPPSELGHLALLLLPGVALSVAAAAASGRLLARSRLGARFVAVALVASVVGLANLAVLARLMFVPGDHAEHAVVLLIYAAAAGAAAALVTARRTSGAVDRLSGTAARIADGDLEVRVGRLDAGPELDALGATLDEMAWRLGLSLESQRRAEAQRKDLMVAVSHDLRTPLSGLRAMVEAIEDGVVDDVPSVRRYVAEMRPAIDSLVVLVDELFELVKLDALAIELEGGRARLEEVVDSAIAACEAQAFQKGLVVETRVDAEGTPCSPRLGPVLRNLVQNAIRHTPADGAVRVRARGTRGAISLVVEDTGDGMDERAIEQIFDPFWRGDPARGGTGHGLGLTLSKRIVEALGGTISVASEPAEGSRFEVLVPEGLQP